MQVRSLLSTAVIVALAMATQMAGARQPDARQSALQRSEVFDAVSGDVPARATAAQRLAPAVVTTPGQKTTAAVTDADVGDADSFGRNVKWLGLASMNVTLTSDCSDPTLSPGCQVVSAAPGTTAFSFDDLAHITLPGNSANSLLCYWFSPVLTVSYNNPTAALVMGYLRYSPTLTLENPVLNDPALIDPTTGVPFAGKLITGMTSSEILQVPLAAGQSYVERTRDSTVCMSGFISKRQLVETYGLTSTQANKFFKKQTVVRMNIAGTSRYIDEASLIFGFRIVGD